MQCKICGLHFEFLGGHIRQSHPISLEDYYNKFINPNCNSTCPVCGDKLKFRYLTTGYSKYCSHKCYSINLNGHSSSKAGKKQLECWEVRICSICGEGFWCYGHSSKKVCSNICKRKWLSKIRSLKIKKQCSWCNNYFLVSPSKSNTRFCSLICYYDWAKETGSIRYGENHPSWIDGKSFEPYTPEFNNKLKEKIRKRDKYVCQECGMTQKELEYTLHVHHIDYDKKNCSENNLISLCNSCHVQTNYSREDWIEYFKNKMKGD